MSETSGTQVTGRRPAENGAHGSYASPAAFIAGFKPAEWVAAAVAATAS